MKSVNQKHERSNWLLATGYWQRTPYASRLATANCQLATADFSLRFANKL
jgi:hypothetical protein